MAHSSSRRRRENSQLAKTRSVLPTSNVVLLDHFAKPLALTQTQARHLYAVPPALDYFPTPKVQSVGGTNTNEYQRQSFRSNQTSSSSNNSRPFRQFLSQKEAIPVFAEQHPRKMTLCEVRDERTQVIHALGHAGRGGQKTPVWTRKSRIKC